MTIPIRIRAAAPRLTGRAPATSQAQIARGALDHAQHTVRVAGVHVVGLARLHEVLVRVKGVVQAEFPSLPVYCDFDTSLPEFEADIRTVCLLWGLVYTPNHMGRPIEPEDDTPSP